jgi:hypothetical protein
MAVIIKSANLAFLLKMGVPLGIVSKVKEAGISFVLGFKDFTFKDKDGNSLYVGMLPIDSNKLSVPAVPSGMKEQTCAVLLEAISAALQASGYAPSGVNEVKAAIKLVEEAVAEKDAKQGMPAEPMLLKKKPSINDAPIALRDANMIYQRVNGTSGGSIYVVVAITQDSKVKVAARVHGDNLSVRVEGEMVDAVRNAFKSQGLDFKKEYMSGHYTCNVNVNPNRVIGAILMGSGLEYSTPLPSMERVRKLCA